MTTDRVDAGAWSALLQLASSNLPVGAFSHSLGLEAAVHDASVHDAASAETFIAAQLHLVWAGGEAPLWLALSDAWQHGDVDAIEHWNDVVVASRDSDEFLLECTQTGHSLRQWLLQLPDITLDACSRDTLAALDAASFTAVHALAAQALGLPRALGLHALGWSLIDNLVMAAVKLVPLGQTQGQAVLRRLASQLPEACAAAARTPPESAQTFAPMSSIRSAHHETQYSRLFRS